MSLRVSGDNLGFLLSSLAGLAVVGCGVYCILWYKPAELSFFNPDISLTCWIFCSTLEPFWGVATLVSGLLPIVAGVLIKAGARRPGALLAIISGLVVFPIGVLPIVGGYLALRRGQGSGVAMGRVK